MKVIRKCMRCESFDVPDIKMEKYRVVISGTKKQSGIFNTGEHINLNAPHAVDHVEFPSVICDACETSFNHWFYRNV